MMVDHRRLSDGGDAVIPEQSAVEKADKSEFPLITGVRASDIEPYTGLRYLSKLFRFMAVILVLLLVAEVATGLYQQGSSAVPVLLGEASRLIVLAGVLWGTGDLAHLLIDVGHDVRAARILAGRATGSFRLTERPKERVVSASPVETVRPTDVGLGFADRGPNRPGPEGP